MPTIVTERIPRIPPRWAEEHPTIQVYLDDHPNGWALEARTQGRRIMRDEDGNGAVYSMEAPPAVTRAIYGWLNSIAPIWTSHWFATHYDIIEWLDHESGLRVTAYLDAIGVLEVSMFDPQDPDGDDLGVAFLGTEGAPIIMAGGKSLAHIERVSATANKYFYPN